MTTLRLLPLVALLASCTSASPAPQAPQAAGPKDDGIKFQEDVIYGRVEGSALLADVAQPAGEGPFPAIISIHGGRWVGGHRRDTSSIKPREWAPPGFFARATDYRLARAPPA